MSATATRSLPVFFLSALVGAPVYDPSGERIAAVHDLIARLDLETRERYPPLTGLVAHIGGRDVFAPWSLVADVSDSGVRLARVALDLGRFERRPGEVLLARDVLDKQLLDLEGRRVIRASDIVLATIGQRVRVVGVDVGFTAIWRRAAPRAVGRRLTGATVIDWEDIEYLAREAPAVRLRGGHPKLARLHPVEIAQLVDQLPNRLGAEIVESLDDEVAADVVEELSDERQADIVERLGQERAADVLEEMEPDEAAYVLAGLPEEKAADLLAEMAPEEAEDVREILAHDEGTAGRIMTTDFVAVPRDATVGQTLDRMRSLPEKPAFTHYVYVVDGEDTGRLVGSVGLPEMVFASPGTLIADIMHADPVRAPADAKVDEIAERFAEYNLLALPIVDEHDRVLGIVTVDDVMEELVPGDTARRLPRIFG